MTTSPAQMIDESTLRIERVLPGTAERVWKYLTEPDLRRGWLAGGTLDPRPGGELTLVFEHDHVSDEPGPTPERFQPSEGTVFQCRIEVWNPPHELSYTWPEPGQEDSFVHFEIQELDEPAGHVRLVLIHSRLRSQELLRGVAGGWHAHLDILSDRIAGQSTGNFWKRYEILEAQYREWRAGDGATGTSS